MDKQESLKEEMVATAEALLDYGSFEWDMEDDTAVYSSGLLRIFNIPPGEHPNPTIIYSLVHPDDLPAFKEAMDKVVARQTSEFPTIEFRINNQDGQLKHLWARIVPEYNAENTFVRISGVIRDITAQKKEETLTDVIYNISRAASELDTSQELFSLIQQELIRLIDASNMFVAYYNKGKDLLDIQYVTGEADIKHVPAEGTMSKMVIMKNVPLLIKKKEMDEMQARGEFVRVGRAAKCWMGLPLRKDGGPFGVIVIQNYNDAQAFDHDDLVLLEIICLQIESAIRKMEDAEQISKLTNSVVHSPATVVITDIDGNIEYVNPKFEEVTGYSFEEAVGKNPNILKSGETKEKVYVELWDTILAGKVWSGEFKNKRKDGSYYWEMASISCVRNKAGKITHFIGVKEDITQRKEMEEELVRAKEKAEEANQLKSSFLANLSHEIRTPMNGILGFSELLRDDDLNKEESNKYIDIINANGNQLMNIISDIITVSNLEVKQLRLNNQEFDLCEMLEEVKSTLFIEQKTLGKEVVLMDFPERIELESCLLYGDRGKLVQIIVNLWRNALKFTDKGYIKLNCRTIDDDMLQFDISDTGLGIPQNIQEVIFERFRQADESSTRNFGGIGLGLAISKGMVELMGGSIWVESEEGKGSTFSFTIPLRIGV